MNKPEPHVLAGNFRGNCWGPGRRWQDLATPYAYRHCPFLVGVRSKGTKNSGTFTPVEPDQTSLSISMRVGTLGYIN